MIDTHREAATIWALDFDAELPCEAHHRNSECSGKVTHWFKACDEQYSVCENAAKFAINRIRENSAVHNVCFEPVAECWSIRPI